MDKTLEYIGTIKELGEKLNTLKKEHNELEKKYLDLRCRYTTQNDELIRLKIFMSKEGYSEDNIRNSKE